jgi:hypothetical protein
MGSTRFESSGPRPDHDDRAASSLLDLSRAEYTSNALSNIHDINGLGQTQLHRAVKNLDMVQVDRLLREGAAIDACDYVGRQPLHYVANVLLSRHSLSIARRLLAYGASPLAQDAIALTPLHLGTGNPQILNVFLASLLSPVIDPLDSHGNSPLLYLLNSAIHPASDEGNSPHMSGQDLRDSILLLLNAGANIDIRNNVGWTPFHLALQLQQRYPSADNMHLALFVEKTSLILDPGPGNETPFSIFLNGIDWHAEADVIDRWVSIAMKFLRKGADHNTKVDGKRLLEFCLLRIRFVEEKVPKKTATFMSLISALCQDPNDSIHFTLETLQQLIWNLPLESESLAVLSLNCLRLAAIKCQILRPLEDKDWCWMSQCLIVLLQRLFVCKETSKAVKFVQILLDAGADPLWAPGLFDRPIYVALRCFRDQSLESLIRVFLLHLINSKTASSIKSADGSLPDYFWFWNWTLSCLDKRWRLTYEDKPLPRDLSSEQKSVLVRTARNILADICIKDAETIYFNPRSSEFDRTWAREQILFILQDPKYQELTSTPSWHTESLLKVILKNSPQIARSNDQ